MPARLHPHHSQLPSAAVTVPCFAILCASSASSLSTDLSLTFPHGSLGFIHVSAFVGHFLNMLLPVVLANTFIFRSFFPVPAILDKH